MSNQDCQTLRSRNPHAADARIQFFEQHPEFGEHIYVLDGKPLPGSVTGFIHSTWFPHFDPDDAIQKLKGGRNWNPQNQYWGMNNDEIKALWKQRGTDASGKGTDMHRNLELFWNDDDLGPHDETSAEWPLFCEFKQQVIDREGLVPFRSEWIAYDDKSRLAGSIDQLFQNPETNEVVIIDWKRCRQIKWENRYQSGTGPLKHMPDCNMTHYTLQLNCYKAMLEKNFGLKVREHNGMGLVFLHPAMEAGGFIGHPTIVWVSDRQSEISCMMRVRRRALKRLGKNCRSADQLTAEQIRMYKSGELDKTIQRFTMGPANHDDVRSKTLEPEPLVKSATHNHAPLVKSATHNPETANGVDLSEAEPAPKRSRVVLDDPDSD